MARVFFGARGNLRICLLLGNGLSINKFDLSLSLACGAGTRREEDYPNE
jgi:hypothetical protein